jgi:uncharacterized membrane protein
MDKKLLFLIVVSLLLRLISLNQSLWLDEAITANVVKNNSYQNIVTRFSPNDFHPPLFYLTQKTWSSVFGYSEVGLRSMSVTFAVLTVILVYLHFGFRPGLLLTLKQLYLYYSQ